LGRRSGPMLPSRMISTPSRESPAGSPHPLAIAADYLHRVVG